MLQLKVIEELVLGYLESLKTCQRFHTSGMNSYSILITNYFAEFLARDFRDVIYTSRAYATMSVFVCLRRKCIGTL